MCYSCLSIRNPSKERTPWQPAFLTVPCGHCSSCKDAKKLSWQIRLYYEYEAVKFLKGYGLFLTLTYNKQCLPWYTFNGVKICPTPSKSDIQKYMKRVRRSLERIYGSEVVSGHISYVIVSEHGELRKRPHYHAIIFCDNPTINKWIFRGILKRQWKFGYSKFGKFCGFLSGNGAFSYVAKYISKDIEDVDYIGKTVKMIQDELDPDFDGSEISDFLLSSQNLGIHALEVTDFNLLMDGHILMPDTEQVQIKCKLPLYLERKAFYEVRPRFINVHGQVKTIPTYFLTDLGLSMKQHRFRKFLNSCLDRVNLFLNYQPLNPYQYVQLFNQKFHCKFRTFSDIQQVFLKRVKDYHAYAIWKIVYQPFYSGAELSGIVTSPKTDYYNRFKYYYDSSDTPELRSFLSNSIKSYKDYSFADGMINYFFQLQSAEKDNQRAHERHDHREQQKLLQRDIKDFHIQYDVQKSISLARIRGYESSTYF